MPESTPAIQDSTTRPRVLSGMRPTGKLHLGNYMGALANWVKLQDQYECYFFIADLHALTTDYADTSRRCSQHSGSCAGLAGGGAGSGEIAPFSFRAMCRSTRSSLLFSMITPLGWLERVPTYKEHAGKP